MKKLFLGLAAAIAIGALAVPSIASAADRGGGGGGGGGGRGGGGGASMSRGGGGGGGQMGMSRGGGHMGGRASGMHHGYSGQRGLASRGSNGRDFNTRSVNRSAMVNSSSRSSRFDREGRRHAHDGNHRHHRHHRHVVAGGWWFPGYYDDYAYSGCYQYSWTPFGYRYVNVCEPGYYGAY